MSIDGRFTTPITVQRSTPPSFGGVATWADLGTCQGYVRPLSARERVSVDKPTLYSTHRVVMTTGYIALYGDRLKIGSTYYKVKVPGGEAPFGQGFQSVDCEVVT